MCKVLKHNKSIFGLKILNFLVYVQTKIKNIDRTGAHSVIDKNVTI